MHCSSNHTIIVVQMSSRSVEDNVAIHAIVTRLELRVEGALLLPDAKLAAKVERNRIVPWLLTTCAV